VNQAQSQTQQTVTLTTTVQGVEAILAALGKLPFESVADLFMSIRQQAVSQLNQAQAAEQAVEQAAPTQAAEAE
jgi:hypothetical protein